MGSPWLKRSNARPRKSGANPGPLIRDVDLTVSACLPRPEGDLAFAVLERVLDEVAEGLPEPQPVGIDGQPVGRLDHERASRRGDPGREALAQVPEQLGDSDSAQVERQLSLRRPCEDEQVLGELDQPVDLDDAEEIAARISSGLFA